jgi:hypothetical protein
MAQQTELSQETKRAVVELIAEARTPEMKKQLAEYMLSCAFSWVRDDAGLAYWIDVSNKLLGK